MACIRTSPYLDEVAVEARQPISSPRARQTVQRGSLSWLPAFYFENRSLPALDRCHHPRGPALPLARQSINRFPLFRS